MSAQREGSSQLVGGVPLSRDLADFAEFPSKGFLCQKKLDLHVAHIAKTEPRYDRLCRGAVDLKIRIQQRQKIRTRTITFLHNTR